MDIKKLTKLARENPDEVNWVNISKCETLSLDFIREFADRVNWRNISAYQKLSPDFIREFADRVHLFCICTYQKLSENLDREFIIDKVGWPCICMYQKLSLDFIREFADKVDWSIISCYQELSEDFIREFKDKVCWYYIERCQKLSPDFMKEFGLKKPENNWLYADNETKRGAISLHYEIVEEDGCEYVLAYKAVRRDNYSLFSFYYKYEEGQTYHAHCDCSLNVENSFGLSAWTESDAESYGLLCGCEYKIVKVKIKLEDVGAFIEKSRKLRCFALTVIGEAHLTIIGEG